MKLWRNLLNVMSKTTAQIFASILIAGIIGVLPFPAEGARAPNQPMDLVFVIDNSGSMKKNDPEFATRQAINDFVIKLPDQSRAGMVLFDEKARLLHRLRIISNPRVQEQFMTSLDKIDYIDPLFGKKTLLRVEISSEISKYYKKISRFS